MRVKKRLTKKRLKKEIDFLEKQIHAQTRATNSIVEILQASGIIDALNGEDAEIIAIEKTDPWGLGTYKTHYKINEVF
jgi:hypothetical protein